MIFTIVDYIKEVILKNHSYFKAGNVSDVVLPNGKILKRESNGEFSYSGIDDSNGIAFYIRIEPDGTVDRGRRLSSSTPSDVEKFICHLVAYAFGDHGINPHNWVAALSNLLRVIPFNSYAGPGEDIIIKVKKTNASTYDNFLEEAKQKVSTSQTFECVSVEFEVIFEVTSSCNVCEDIQDICSQSEIPLLPCDCPDSGSQGLNCSDVAACPIITNLQDQINNISEGKTKYIAGENLGGQRVVMISNGQAFYFDPSDENNAGRQIGMTISSSVIGDEIIVQKIGILSGFSGSLIQDQEYFAGLNGTLITAPINVGVDFRIGIAIDTNNLTLEFSEPVIII